MQARPKVSDGGHPSSVAVLRSVDEARRLQQQRDTAVRCHDGLKRGPLKATLMLMIKTYILKPTMTLNTLATKSNPGKAGNRPTKALVPPRPRLPAPVIDPIKPILQLGLDVHLQRKLGGQSLSNLISSS